MDERAIDLRPQHIQDTEAIIAEYLKKHLEVVISVDRYDYSNYGETSTGVQIVVRLYLGDDLISETSAWG